MGLPLPLYISLALRGLRLFTGPLRPEAIICHITREDEEIINVLLQKIADFLTKRKLSRVNS